MGSILEALDREWSELATSPRARRALIRWTNRHLVFAGLDDLQQVLDTRKDLDRGEVIQRALAEESADGDDFATRTLLKIVTPGLITIAARRGHADDDALDAVMTLGWERIRTYPCHRPGRIAANVVRDVEKRYLVAHSLDHPTSDTLDVDLTDVDHSTEDQVLGRLVLHELATAQRRGLVTNSALALILRTRVGAESVAELAKQHGISEQVLYQRRWRAEVRLRRLPIAA